jgi:two-component system, NtrC family, response regulator HydG
MLPGVHGSSDRPRVKAGGGTATNTTEHAATAMAAARHPTLLVVDDEPSILHIVGHLAAGAGFDFIPCPGGRQAIDRLQQGHIDMAVVDLRMPEIGGIEVLRAIRSADPECQVVLMSGDATIDSAVEAVKLGAIDYLTKPFDIGRLKGLMGTVRDDFERRRKLLAADGEIARNAEFCGMIGRSAAMQELFSLIRRLGPHVRTALITGEIGSGKELVARALYENGPRRALRFVPINCSAVVESLFESELFGHVRGAFTGATDNKTGLFELADGGTIFLDEVGELPLGVQAKLLRALENGEVQRVGSLQTKRVNVHVLAASNRDLHAEVAAGRFRSDLLYRLNTVELRVPALRERREDIPYLTAAFIRQTTARLSRKVVGTTPGAERALATAAWPGNVRELRNVIERACILAESEFISEQDLNLLERVTPVAAQAVSGNPDDGSLSTLERNHIADVLKQTHGNKLLAARILGLDRRALYRRLERYGIGTVTRRLR